MGLKAFHLLFIVASTALSLLLTGWSLREYGDTGEGLYLAIGFVALAGAVGLGVYLPWFLKKLRHVSYLALAGLLLGSSMAQACPVCIGDPNHPMTISANAGITFLLAIIGSVLMGFGGLFLWWRRREKVWQASAN